MIPRYNEKRGFQRRNEFNCGQKFSFLRSLSDVTGYDDDFDLVTFKPNK